MIQYTTTRQPPAGVSLLRPSTEGPEPWGQWFGRKHYSLEVIQHPSRARMCGFGDKDRRPLAPAAVAKMVVRNEDNSLVDIDDVDITFFLVTADLWSADGTQEMNLVLHPSSAERYTVPHQATAQPKPRKKEKNGPDPTASPGPNPASVSNSGQGRPPAADTAGGRRSLSPGFKSPSHAPSPPPSFPPNNPQGYPFPPPSDLTFSQYGQSAPGAPGPSPLPAWGYSSSGSGKSTPFVPPVLPSIHSIGRDSWSGAPSPSSEAYRPWDNNGWTSASNSTYNSASPFPNSSSNQPQSSSQGQGYPPSGPPTNSSSIMPATSTMPPLPRHTYTRTLVGPLCSNATRLLDEHRKPGIFFLFQDLSVRTEGTFRLRLRLMNVGAPPAPEPGSQKVHTDVSPVLAQIYTDPFTVYSAKRFPGVPDTTALSIAFGNQGQKLPLRNRNGPKRKRGSDSEGDDDSDGD